MIQDVAISRIPQVSRFKRKFSGQYIQQIIDIQVEHPLARKQCSNSANTGDMMDYIFHPRFQIRPFAVGWSKIANYVLCFTLVNKNQVAISPGLGEIEETVETHFTLFHRIGVGFRKIPSCCAHTPNISCF